MDSPSFVFRGLRSRSYTRPEDGKSRGAARTNSTGAVVYLSTEEGTDLQSKGFKNGTLVHELVHALDLVYGRYESEVTVREKRAVFFQNIWRDHVGRKVRSNYHDRFPTGEYEKAKTSGQVDAVALHILTKAGLP